MPALPDNIPILIHKAITKAIEDALESEMASLRKRVEDRVRGDVGQIAARVLEHFTFERYHNTLRIEVKFDNTQPSA